MAVPNFEFTSDTEIQAWNHEDRAIDLTGYVDTIDGLKTVKTAQDHVLKFVLNNASRMRIRVLIWGSEMAQKSLGSIRLNEIIEITGGTIKTSNPVFRIPNEDVAHLEFHVQNHSVLTFHSQYQNNFPVRVVSFTPTSMVDLRRAVGNVEVEGFIKSKGFTEVKTYNASYGQGFIASGDFRLTVHIASFQRNPRHERGVHVKLRGVIHKEGGGCIKVEDMDGVEVLEDPFLSWRN